MIKAPHRRLISSLVIVTAFWMSVITVWYLVDHKIWDDLTVIKVLLLHTLGRFTWILAFVLASAGMTLLLRASEIFTVTLGLRPEQYRGAWTTIGVLPQPELPTGAQKEYAVLARLEAVLKPWAKDPHLNTAAVLHLAKQETPEARLFWNVFHILQDSRLPASPRAGEHGGASLLEHSLRVCAALAWVWTAREEAALKESAERIKQLPTNVTQPLESAPYPLEIAILTGIAHDVGKVACFKKSGDGSIQVIGLHDMVGSRILGKLPSFWNLRDEQGNPDPFVQHLLTQSIRYYHHPNAFPMSGFKREMLSPDPAIQQLMGDIRQADLIAGALEGRQEEIAQDYLEEEDLEEQGLEEQIWDAFLFLMEDASRVNSPSPARRIAYKKEHLLYLIEPKIRERICDHLSITRMEYAIPHNGNPGKIIQIIAGRLDAKGWLIKGFGNFSVEKPEGAGVRLQFTGTTKDGEQKEVTEEKIPHYLVRLGDTPFADLQALGNWKADITVVKLFWPQYGPKGKSEKEAEAEQIADQPIENKGEAAPANKGGKQGSSPQTAAAPLEPDVNGEAGSESESETDVGQGSAPKGAEQTTTAPSDTQATHREDSPAEQENEDDDSDDAGTDEAPEAPEEDADADPEDDPLNFQPAVERTDTTAPPAEPSSTQTPESSTQAKESSTQSAGSSTGTESTVHAQPASSAQPQPQPPDQDTARPGKTRQDGAALMAAAQSEIAQSRDSTSRQKTPRTPEEQARHLERAQKGANQTQKTTLTKREMKPESEQIKAIGVRVRNRIRHTPECGKQIGGISLSEDERRHLLFALIWLEQLRADHINVQSTLYDPGVRLQILLSTFFSFPISTKLESNAYAIFNLLIERSGLESNHVFAGHIAEMKMFLSLRIQYVNNIKTFDPCASTVIMPVNSAEDAANLPAEKAL